MIFDGMAEKGKYADLIAVIKRRPIGKGAWRMDIAEVMDLVQEALDQLKAIGEEHPSDAATQNRVTKGTTAAAEAITRLSLMMFYRDEKEADTNGQLATIDGAANANGGE